MKHKKFESFDSQGNPWGIVSVEQMWGDLFVLKYNRPEKRLAKNEWDLLFLRAKEQAIQFGAKTIGIRLRLEYEPQLFQSILLKMDFKKIAGRIEYKSDVASLPSDKDSPLVWKTAKELGWGDSKIANFSSFITSNALDIDPNQKPEDFIQDWLHHDELTHGPDCIAIGFLENKPITMSVVQINKESGWSRVAYMGVIPEYRNCGLGKWVHRQGFRMMKEQGGKLYHGGTHSENLPMRRLFESHGCELFCEMEEWALGLI